MSIYISEEEALAQMVRDFIEHGGSNCYSSSSSFLKSNSQQLRASLVSFQLQEILEKVTDAEKEILEKISSYLISFSKVNKKRAITGTQKREMIVNKLKMDGYDASLCITSWFATFGRLSNKDHPMYRREHEYVDVLIPALDHGSNNSSKDTINNNSTTRLIVELDFRSQFKVDKPTPTYKKLSKSIPSIFVGTEDKLMKIIPLICSATKQELKGKGLHIAPWRKTKYVQCKWLSGNRKRVSSIFPAHHHGEDIKFNN